MWVFLAVSFTVLGVEMLRNRSFFNMNLLISGPYILIITLNNLFLKYWGYDAVSDDSLFRYSFLILLVFLGGFVCDMVLPKYYGLLERNQQSFSFTPDERLLGKIRIYLCIVIALRMIDVLRIFMSLGVQGIVSSDFEALNMSGLPGHLMLSGYVLIPYLFDAWIKNRGWKNLLVMSAFFVTSFLSFVKYQIIIIIVILFVFYCFQHPEKSGKALGMLVFGAVGIFLLSYVISYVMQDMASIGVRFYLSRLWTYISGGTLILDPLTKEGCSFSFVKDWLPAHIGAPGNLLSAFLGMDLHEIPLIGYRTIGHLVPGGDPLRTNVFSEFAYFALLSSPWITGVMGFLTGFISQFLFQTGRRIKHEGVLIFICLVMGVNFLGFFSNYYSLSAIWEMLLFAIVLPPLFRRLPSLDFRR